MSVAFAWATEHTQVTTHFLCLHGLFGPPRHRIDALGGKLECRIGGKFVDGALAHSIRHVQNVSADTFYLVRGEKRESVCESV